MLTLHVDAERWQRHLDEVVRAYPGIVPVAKGNGYGLGLRRLAETAERLRTTPDGTPDGPSDGPSDGPGIARGIDTLAVGTYAEVPQVGAVFGGDLLVLTPWRPFETGGDPDPRVVHTVGRVSDLDALAATGSAERRPRVVLELLTSMRRHGFTPRELREAADHVEGVAVEGFALHLPMTTGSHLGEVERLLTDLVASGIPARRVYVSHLTRDELAALASSWADFELRPRIGTELWLGDRGALQVRATVLDVHPVERGDVFGYRGRSAPKQGHIVVVSGGTAHGIGLEAPTGGATLRDRAARIARGGLDAAGFVRSPFTLSGKQRLFAEPPHMQASMLFLPQGAPVPAIGDEVAVQVRFTTSSFDRIDLS